MKKIACLLLLIQSGLMMSQTETVPSIYGKKVQINPFVDSGLTPSNGHIQLGGELLQPSFLTTSSTFPLAIKGLQTALPADNFITTEADGILKTIKGATFVWNLTGNAETDPENNFVGTTEDQPLRFKVNAINAGFISSGSVALGYNKPYTGSSEGIIAFGGSALMSYTGTSSNTAIGLLALTNLTTGSGNIAFGNAAIRNASNTNNNIAFGLTTLTAAALASDNLAFGNSALSGNTGARNMGIGGNAMWTMTSGNSNLAMGYFAGVNYNNVSTSYVKTSNNSIFLGDSSSPKADGETNEIVIGATAGNIGRGSNSVQIGNGAVTNIGGQVGWSVTSDVRLKKDIKDSEFGLNFITKLRPVTYKMKTGTTDLQTGFIAQEVEAAANSINYEFNGIVKPQTDADFYSLRYSEFVVPLVKAVQEQQKHLEANDTALSDIEARLQLLEEKLK